MLSVLTPRQFADWWEFYQLEPWGFEPKDQWHGSLVAHIVRGWATKDAVVTPRDFMLRPPEEPKAQDGGKPGSMDRLLRALGVAPKSPARPPPG